MDIDFSGVESAIDSLRSAVDGVQSAIQPTDTNGIEEAIRGISTLDDDSLLRVSMLAVCVVGAVCGWRKVLAALAVFILFEFSNSDTPNKAINLFLSILIAGAARWIFNWLRVKFRKKPAVSEAAQ